MKKDFEKIEHTADIKIRVFGKDQQELFHNALIGMFQSIKPKAKSCIYKNERLLCKELPEEHEIQVDSFNLESLLVDFLSEALYLSDVNNEAYLDVDIKKLSSTNIHAILKGVKIEGFEVTEIKAVTYHDLKIKIENGIWQTDIVFDI